MNRVQAARIALGEAESRRQRVAENLYRSELRILEMGGVLLKMEEAVDAAQYELDQARAEELLAAIIRGA